MTRRCLSWGFWIFFAWLPPADAETPRLLEEALQKWEAGSNDWAFTQRVRTFDDDKVKLERLERYDPSRPDNQRWQLLEIDRKPPTNAHREYWEKRKNRKAKRRTEGALEKYFDFGHATIAKETAEAVRYAVPLRKDATRLAPLEKISIEVSIDKATRSIEQVTGGMREPFRVVLGLGKITDLWLDVRFDPIMHDLTPEDGEPQASGEAHVVVFKMGDRVEYAWSDFKRVTPFSEVAQPPAKTRAKAAAGS